MCMMGSADVPFEPPLTSVEEALPRLLAESRRAMKAQWSWLVREPVATGILLFTSALGSTILIGGKEWLRDVIDMFPLANKVVSMMFGSVETFFSAVKVSFYFAIVAHALEAVYVAHQLKTRLGLETIIIMEWFFIICCVGYPITKKGMVFIKIANALQSKKNA